mmetsp:Transcript_118933/g.167122  ORF Transcript_118933/g.167122 Transcript_118933/m.167122 type:complete len:157 (-) Transcript_118933:166-636(-)
MHLKRKKAYEQQLNNLQSQKMNISTMQMKLEEGAMAETVLNAQRQGASELKKVFGKMTPDAVDDQMDEVREAMDNANEVTEAISQPLGDPLDDDELLDELDQLDQEDLVDQMMGIDAPTSKLPDVPSNDLPVAAGKTKAQTEEEDALAQLEAELNA